jgi:predicted phosphoadenosine phosphosulfate sulfurtransferase
MKLYNKDKNVLEASIERIEFLFNEFEHVYFSVSGGKDSSLMVQLGDIVAKKMNRKFDVMFLDQEAIYKYTSDHIEELKKLESINEFYHICLPFYEDNALSVFQTQWKMWDDEQTHLWVREKTEKEYNNIEFWGKYWDENPDKFMVKFGEWYRDNHNAKVASVVGIRANESYHRFRAIAFGKNLYKDKTWTTLISKNLYNIYPIFDYETSDVWAAVFKLGFTYNEFYEWMYKSGESIHQARICQPYGHEQKAGLNQYAKIEPDTWHKVVNRVSGANFGNIYCKTTLLGHNGSNKPDHMTWEEYAIFLLESIGIYCPELMDHYYRKIKILIGYYYKTENKEHLNWTDTSTASEVREDPIKWYSWKRIALAIEKNDYELKTCQYGLTKQDEQELYYISKKYGKLLGIEEKKTKPYQKLRDLL